MVLKRFISFVLVIYLGCFVFGDNAPQDTKNYNSRCKPKVSQLKYKVSMQEAKDLHHNEEISVKNHSNSKKCKDKKLKDFPTKKITKTLSFKASVVNSASMSYPTLKSNIKPAYFQEEVSVSKHSYPTSQTKELKDKNYNSVSKNSKKTSATSSVMSYPTSKSKYNEFYQKVSLTKYSSPTSETKEQKKNNNNSVLTPEKEGEKGNKKTTTKVLPVSTSTPTLQPKVLFSGQGTGTYYYDSNDKVCPGSS
ncbi:hypothetical protein HK099_006788 [Clydaea vesicula]|uniref:Uncharacterized protein n=1 Tax=Clydaea vesicula TaxID=447962 RepID=A0AAD5XY07_9FUNG|nr:hypothetical protein HK099_006788 [Clydaea vesicula]